MQRFAERTGLDSDRPRRRYLWTDAFAVCNELALADATGAAHHLVRARQLVDQVHRVLGRHRSDDARSGWLSGSSEAEGERHPTRGGLRIGKKLPERAAGAPFDERLEWERDGQYFHYLTRWMHALDQMARATGEVHFNTWARELAEVAYRAFSAGPDRRMVWKMSIDLSRALVPSMGQHDPLDGLVTAVQLRTTAASLPGAPERPRLDEAVEGFARLVDTRSLATGDPLGLGGLLVDAGRVAQLMGQGAFGDGALLEALLTASLAGFSLLQQNVELDGPASRRLAFRELGLAIGIAALGPAGRALRSLGGLPIHARAGELFAALEPTAALGASLTSFWRDPASRRNHSWAEHGDINDVMLAASLIPDGVAVLRPLGEALRPTAPSA